MAQALIAAPAAYDPIGQASEIDSITLVHAPNLRLGQLLQVHVTGSNGYDLVA
jgi:hypothetical protein